MGRGERGREDVGFFRRERERGCGFLSEREGERMWVSFSNGLGAQRERERERERDCEFLSLKGLVQRERVSGFYF